MYPRSCKPKAPPGSSRAALSVVLLNYLTVTEAPAPSRAALALSAASLLTFSRTVFGAPSTRSLASFRPRLVSDRTSLMTWIFLSPAASRMTSNSSCSSAASASPPAPPLAVAATPPATATGAAALTSNVSSKAFTNSDSSRSVISLNASSRSALLSFAIIVSFRSLILSLCLRLRRLRLRRAGLGLSLGAQRVGEQRHLRRQRVERRRRVGHRRLHGAGQLGEQHLARLEVGQLADLRRGQRLAVEHATLDHEQRVRLGEVEQALGSLRHVPADERDRGRPRQHRRDFVAHASLAGRDLRERVLHD